MAYAASSEGFSSKSPQPVFSTVFLSSVWTSLCGSISEAVYAPPWLQLSETSGKNWEQSQLPGFSVAISQWGLGLQQSVAYILSSSFKWHHASYSQKCPEKLRQSNHSVQTHLYTSLQSLGLFPLTCTSLCCSTPGSSVQCLCKYFRSHLSYKIGLVDF